MKKATKSAAKAAKDATLGFDELNVIQPKTESENPTVPTGADKSLDNTDFGAASAKPLISEEQIKKGGRSRRARPGYL